MSLPHDAIGEELRVLILEDRIADADLSQRELRRAGLRFTARRVQTRAEFETALDKFRPDLIISDFTLPGTFDGLTALELARTSFPHVPFVLVSGTLGEENAVKAMKLGAADYVLKDRMERLGPAALQALEAARLRKEKELAEAALRGSPIDYRELVEQAADGIFVADRTGKILLANARCCEMLGYGDEELIGLDLAETYPEGERAQLDKRIAELAKIKTGLFERMMRRKDGTCFPAEISFKYLDNGTHLGIVRDISERRREQKMG
jgi:PAS domain S-box-containing protein